MAGTLGRISFPRAVASKLIALSSWFCQEEPRTVVQAQIVGGRWVRAFQFCREVSSILDNLEKSVRRKNCGLAAGFSPESMIDDVFLPVCVWSICVPRSAPLWASDASKWRLRLSRTSSLTVQRQVALQESSRPPHNPGGSMCLIELFAGLGGPAASNGTL